MKIAVIAFLILLYLAVLPADGQTVTITGQKKVYTRQQRIAGFKKTFTVRRPIARAATPALSRKITSALDPVSVLDIRIKEELTESQWLHEADFEEVLNENGMLTMMLWMEGAGAYSDGVTKYVVVDVAKGERVRPVDAFGDIDGLIAAVKKKQAAEMEEAIKRIKAEPEFGDNDPRQLFEYTDFKVGDLDNFAADRVGVAFFYDYGFPTALRGLEPEGELRLSWEEVKPFLKPGGLLARFAP